LPFSLRVTSATKGYEVFRVVGYCSIREELERYNMMDVKKPIGFTTMLAGSIVTFKNLLSYLGPIIAVYPILATLPIRMVLTVQSKLCPPFSRAVMTAEVVFTVKVRYWARKLFATPLTIFSAAIPALIVWFSSDELYAAIHGAEIVLIVSDKAKKSVELLSTTITGQGHFSAITPSVSLITFERTILAVQPVRCGFVLFFAILANAGLASIADFLGATVGRKQLVAIIACLVTVSHILIITLFGDIAKSGIELDAEYVEIARARIEHWASKPRQRELL